MSLISARSISLDSTFKRKILSSALKGHGSRGLPRPAYETCRCAVTDMLVKKQFNIDFTYISHPLEHESQFDLSYSA
jgi:hypothetical protein